MTETVGDAVQIVRRFNHDLLVEKADQDAAARRWPALAHVLINPELVRGFTPHEERAKTLKRSVHVVGSIAVLMMLAALLGYAAELWLAKLGSGEIPYLALFSETCAIAALLLSLLASRYGPLRRRWLKHRFVTEVLRQWHFRRLLDGKTIPQSHVTRDQVIPGRNADLSAIMASLAGAVGAKMDELSELRRDPLGHIPRTSLPENPETRSQLLDAYRVLRLDHQRDFAMYKLSADDKTFAGLPLVALSSLTELLAGTTLVLALVCAVARLFIPFAWAPIVAVSDRRGRSSLARRLRPGVGARAVPRTPACTGVAHGTLGRC
jgi:hypothetical protein